MSNKATIQLLAEVEKLPGWRIERRGAGWRVYPPDLEKSPITVHSSVSDFRGVRNLRADLRRAGADL